MPSPLSASLAAVLLSITATAQVHRYDHDRRVELAIDATRIAVFDESRDAAGLRAVLAGRELDIEALEAWPVRGWWLVPTRGSARNAAGSRALVRELADRGVVDFASSVLLGDDGRMLIPGRDVFVGLADPDDDAFVERVLARDGTVERDALGLRGIVRVRASQRAGLDVLDRANALALEPGVLFADVDYVYTGGGDHLPSDLYFQECWGLHNLGTFPGSIADFDMDCPEAWDLTLGSPAIRIAILDVGVQPDHPDLRVLPGADVTSDGPGTGSPRNSCDNHGTQVAGAAAARADNFSGGCGSAPRTSIVSIRTLIALPACNSTWTTTTAWVVAALGQAQSLGCRVTNCSNGLQSQPVVTAAYDQLHAAGIVHFASTGNGGLTTIHYPASLANVNGVGAIQANGTRPTWSNTGTGIDLAAPGLSIWTTDRTGAAGVGIDDYGLASGTSMSAPYAAGVAALILSRNPNLGASEVDTLVRSSARDLGAVGYDTSFGFGLVQARAALDATGASCMTSWTTCATSPNSVGAGALLAASGTPSLLANDFVVQASGCPANAPGRFVIGADTFTAQITFGNGFRCLTSPQTRFPNQVTSASGVANRAIDWSQLPGGLGSHAGQTWNFQFLYRNPLAGGAGYNSSDALGVTLCP